ncbi:MAG: ACP S-malonyltransferase [Thermoleophilia bacterium]|nr:ACP S-malonyltransferase [Thermoleophilia bacterium]
MAEHLWDFAVAREVFAEASTVLGWDVGELCRHGSMEELTRTDRTQLTILTCSVALWRVLEAAGATFLVAAGHSLGEYSALVATGHMGFADALRVVDVRGRGMQACAEERGGTMAAVIGLDSETIEEICSRVADVWVANYNSPGQVVISGAVEAVRAAGEEAQQRGAKRVLPLPVSGAFHTPLMAGAAEALARALGEVRFVEGPRRFFSTTELCYPGPDELAAVLARQLMSPVRFTQSMEALLAGAEAPGEGLEVGPGNVLTGLTKRIARDFPVASTGDRESLEKALERAGDQA